MDFIHQGSSGRVESMLGDKNREHFVYPQLGKEGRERYSIILEQTLPLLIGLYVKTLSRAPLKHLINRTLRRNRGLPGVLRLNDLSERRGDKNGRKRSPALEVLKDSYGFRLRAEGALE